MISQGAAATSADLPTSTVYHTVKFSGHEGMKYYFQGYGCDVFHCTAGAFDAVYVPPGWVLAERIQHNADCVGFRQASVLKTTLAHMDDMNRHLILSGKPRDPLQKAVDAFHLEDES